MTTNVPSPTFGDAGFVAPTEPAILSGVQTDINAAFGGALNPALNTPQGQLATSLTAYLGYINALFVYLTNMLDPAYSEGRYQDALARIYFIERNPSQPTVVLCTCTGLAGVVIPAGMKAVDGVGNTYLCTQTGSIGTNGMVSLAFANILPGPIVCPSGTLNQIYQLIPGWDTITNPADGVLGSYTETRSAFETRRAASVAHNSIGALPSVLGAVLSVPNVLDAYVVENVANVINTIGGVTLAPNSIYVAVAGGSAAAVAQAIWSKKAPGCAYNGNTTVVVQDTRSGYSPPYPSYNVSFQVSIPLNIYFSVVILNTVFVPVNAGSLIQAAIVNAFAGGDGGPRARIGTTVLASRFYAPVAALGPWAQIISLEIGIAANAANLFEVPVGINQIPAIAAGNITVALG